MREAVAKEINLVEADEQLEELDELKLVGELERLINQGIQMTERARTISQEIFDQRLERKCWPLVDERHEIEEASQHKAFVRSNVYRVTVTVSLISVVFGRRGGFGIIFLAE